MPIPVLETSRRPGWLRRLEHLAVGDETRVILVPAILASAPMAILVVLTLVLLVFRLAS